MQTKNDAIQSICHHIRHVLQPSGAWSRVMRVFYRAVKRHAMDGWRLLPFFAMCHTESTSHAKLPKLYRGNIYIK